MKRDRDSARPPMTARPRRMSSSQSSGRGALATSRSRLPARDLMGASELFISWPRTRMRRCQACRSSSRRARLTSDSTSSRWGSPPWRKRPPRASKRPTPPGRVMSRTRGSSAVTASSRPSSAAVRPRSCSSGRPSRRSPARLARRRRCSPSRAKTATSISSMTWRRRAVASRAPRRWERRVSARAFTSSMACPRASSGRGLRARKLKSSSRKAASRFDSVCRGRMHRVLAGESEAQPEEDHEQAEGPLRARREVADGEQDEGDQAAGQPGQQGEAEDPLLVAQGRSRATPLNQRSWPTRPSFRARNAAAVGKGRFATGRARRRRGSRCRRSGRGPS